MTHEGLRLSLPGPAGKVNCHRNSQPAHLSFIENLALSIKHWTLRIQRVQPYCFPGATIHAAFVTIQPVQRCSRHLPVLFCMFFKPWIMIIKITLFITLLMYAIVISQSVFYILAMSSTLKKMQAETYIETRNLLTKTLEMPLQVVYYTALGTSVLLTAFCVVNPSGWLFIGSVIALITLVADAILATKGNIPLNKLINSWTSANYPSNWKQYRSKWFTLYHVRQALNITGFVSLLAGWVFGV